VPLTLATFSCLTLSKGSNVHRVVVHVDQGSDSYRFYPGPATKYDTQFNVVLVGAVLEFRTVFSEPVPRTPFHLSVCFGAHMTLQEGDMVKTIHGKQSVQLPTPPSLDQITHSGNEVTVRTKASDVQYTQADVAIPITL